MWRDWRLWALAAIVAAALLGFVFYNAGGKLSGRGGLVSEIAPGVAAAPPSGAVPSPEPLVFKDTAPEDAVAINAAVPVSDLPNPAARPFAASWRAETDRMRSLECLTAAIYYEAAIEPMDGQRAVAQVVLNRVRHPAFPNSVCGVVFQGSERVTGCQFTFTCDGSLRRVPSATGWQRARKVAEAAQAGAVFAPVGHATHYHTNWVVPYWSSSLTKVANVGSHIFYRWQGGWGGPAAFRARPAASEPEVPLMRHLTSVPLTEVLEVDLEIPGLQVTNVEALPLPDSLPAPALVTPEPAYRPGSVLASQAREPAQAGSAKAERPAKSLPSLTDRAGQKAAPQSNRVGCRHTALSSAVRDPSLPPPC